MWTWVSDSGQLLKDAVILVDTGYSGKGSGKNNPDCEAVPDMGPIPQGDYDICGPPYDTKTHGPYVLRLEPCPGTITFNRAGFLIHGDSLESPGEASEGCIILPRATRSRIWQSGDTKLEVIRTRG